VETSGMPEEKPSHLLSQRKGEEENNQERVYCPSHIVSGGGVMATSILIRG